jgi:hypothetical protein
MNQFRSAIATQLHVSVAQVTILDVKPGSIVVVFAVQAANLDTVQQQLDDDVWFVSNYVQCKACD